MKTFFCLCAYFQFLVDKNHVREDCVNSIARFMYVIIAKLPSMVMFLMN